MKNKNKKILIGGAIGLIGSIALYGYIYHRLKTKVEREKIIQELYNDKLNEKQI